jgi:hypothetical protein
MSTVRLETFSRIPWAALGWAVFILLHAHRSSAIFALPVLIAGIALAALCNQIEFTRRVSQVELGLLVFGIAWLLTAWLGLDPVRSLSLSVPTLVALICAFVLPRAQPPHSGLAQQFTLWALSLLGVLACLAVLASLPAERPEDLVESVALPWLVVPNDLAWVGCLWPWWWRWARERKSDVSRWVALVLASLVLLGALLALQSRLGLLVLALSAGLELGRESRRLRWAALVSATLAAPALLTSSLMEKGLASGGARLQLWQAAWQQFLDYPVFGVGPHGFVAAFPELWARGDLIDPRVTPWPHSLPLEILSGGGLLLVLASVMLIALRLRAAGGLLPRAVGVSFLLVCLLEASTLRMWFWIWFVLMMLPLAERRVQAP